MILYISDRSFVFFCTNSAWDIPQMIALFHDNSLRTIQTPETTLWIQRSCEIIDECGCFNCFIYTYGNEIWCLILWHFFYMRQVVGTLYTHHQKCVIVVTQANRYTGNAHQILNLPTIDQQMSRSAMFDPIFKPSKSLLIYNLTIGTFELDM